MKSYNFFRQLTYAVCFCTVALIAISCYTYCLCSVALFVANFSEGPMSLTTEEMPASGTPPRKSEPVRPAPVNDAYMDAQLIAMSNQIPAMSTCALEGDFVR